MSRQAMWNTVQMAWSMLSGRAQQDVRPGRPRERRPPPPEPRPTPSMDGFVEEALPWLDAVYRFSLRLTRGNRDAAEDLVQDTFVRAHRFWHTYRRGTNAKSWLFTVCRTTYLHQKELIRSQREVPATDLDARVEALAAASAMSSPPRDPEKEFFERLIDDEVVEAIDSLPDEFREALVLSDLGDLTYGEIAEVLNIPVGTAKSRLFRARRVLQKRLQGFAARAGYAQETA